MDRSSRQRIWKVEKLLSKAEELVSIARQKREKSRAETLAWLMPIMRGDARPHATAVAAIVISGEPKVDEPLVRAWARTLAHHRMDLQDSTLDKHATLKAVERKTLKAVERKMYPAIVEDPDYGTPRWDPSIGHAPEAARFSEIFRTAPVWLLQFTMIRLDAWLLKFDLPDISAELMWGVEGVNDSKRWPLLPLGTMAAGDPVRTTPEEFDSDLTVEERRFYQQVKERPEEEWSRLERRRMRELIERLTHSRVIPSDDLG
jgi:hypothetical protein